MTKPTWSDEDADYARDLLAAEDPQGLYAAAPRLLPLAMDEIDRLRGRLELMTIARNYAETRNELLRAELVARERDLAAALGRSDT